MSDLEHMDGMRRGILITLMAIALFGAGFFVGDRFDRGRVASVAVRFYPMEGCVVFSDVHGGETPCFKDGSRFLLYDDSILENAR